MEMSDIQFVGQVERHDFGPWPVRARVGKVLRGAASCAEYFLVCPTDQYKVAVGERRVFAAAPDDQFCCLVP
jgi:hypothetical protein